jgi:photosystem II stability/assembly factor-like uncharacterized protein
MLLLKSNKVMLVIIWLMFSSDVFSQWETQNSGVTSKLRSVCFVDTLHGWVVGDSSVILKTDNGGKDWSQQTSPVKYISLSKVQFVSKITGFVLGDSSLFLSTHDGGVNWDTNYVTTDTANIEYTDFCFVNENEGWVCGRKEGRNYGIGLILHTSDAGKTWEKQLETFTQVQTEAKFFSAIEFKDNMTGWALASDYFDNFSSAYIYKTSSGGFNWQIIGEMIYPNWKLSIAKEDTLWSGGGPLLISTDSGYTWDKPKSEFYPCQVISPESGLRGWVFNYDLFLSTRKIFRTTNGGDTWLEELNLDEFVINDMTNVSGILWVVGSDGLIMREQPIVMSVAVEHKTLQKEVILGQNYPNPFNPTTTIEYEIPTQSNVKIEVFDVLGRDIETLLNKEQTAGNYRLNFNGSKISCGIYFYRITANSLVQTKKMILTK